MQTGRIRRRRAVRAPITGRAGAARRASSTWSVRARVDNADAVQLSANCREIASLGDHSVVGIDNADIHA